MARYYFPSFDGGDASPDFEGVELESIDDARACAVRALVELARELLDGSSTSRVLMIEVLDEDGRCRFSGRLTFEAEAGDGGPL